MAIQFKDIVREYLENSSLHGAKFIVDPHNHILERYSIYFILLTI